MAENQGGVDGKLKYDINIKDGQNILIQIYLLQKEGIKMLFSRWTVYIYGKKITCKERKHLGKFFLEETIKVTKVR